MERDFARRMEGLGHKYWSQFSLQDTQNPNGNNSNTTAAANRLFEPSYILLSPSRQQDQQQLDAMASPSAKSPNNYNNRITNNADQQQQDDSQRSILHCADVFFSKVFLASQAQTQTVQEYTTALMQILSDDIDNMIVELQQILKDSRAVFRKNSDICRLSEAAVRNFLSCVTIAYESSVQASLKEIALLSDEITGLKGGVAYHPAYFVNVKKVPWPSLNNSTGNNTSAMSVIDFSEETADTAVATVAQQKQSISPGESVTVAALHVTAAPFTALASSPSPALALTASGATGSSGGNGGSGVSGTVTNKAVAAVILAPPREDLWLNVQRYKTAVRDSQEALCVLIAESMDLELQRQIIANKVHLLFTNAIRQYAKQELSLFAELHSCWTQLMRDCLFSIKEHGLPYPILQSPFSKLNPILELTTSDATTDRELLRWLLLLMLLFSI
jgi:hypothetical protein